MSMLDAEQSARYIDSLVASVQALEADLAATRDRLRQAESEQDRMEHREQELQAIIAATGFEKDELRAKASAAEARASEANHRATRIALDAELKSQLEQAQARIAALEADAKLASTDEILRVWRETSKADARGREEK